MNGSETDDIEAEPASSPVPVCIGGLVVFSSSVGGDGVIVSLIGGVNVISVGSVVSLFCSSGNELQPNTSCAKPVCRLSGILQ